MKGIIITYEPKDSISRVLLNHELFGRVQYTNRGGNKIAYYQPGILHNTKFHRICNSKVFVEKSEFDSLSKSLLSGYGDVSYFPVELDESTLDLRTGEEHWKEKVWNRHYLFKMCVRRKYGRTNI